LPVIICLLVVIIRRGISTSSQSLLHTSYYLAFNIDQLVLSSD